ncbi:putative alkaline serine protease [Parachaetomium inaequale]|uniref:Alkaline serine protease n=1 Tax=Parachaetomium inaequale TaxID=2588326 RepID=A0AAN6P731_9PEZI|nr:putative alkaline serine protease [Parachaetomium inaequale]
MPKLASSIRAQPVTRSNNISLVESKTSDPTAFGVTIHHEFDLPDLRGYAAAFDETTKSELEGLPEVAAIEPVYIYRHCVGATEYVIDTGINHMHDDFEGRASKGPKFVTSPTPISDEDESGHGTHVASTIAGKTYGVAKKAKVVGIKVLNEYKRTGKQYMVNISLGGGPSAILDSAMAALVRGGVTVIVAAGNLSTQLPAREPLAITVGATGINDVIATFSNYSKMVDIFAPGVNILSTWIGSTTARRAISGTSMASPHVAGAVACWLGSTPKSPLLVMPQLLIWAEKADITGLKDRTINALLQVSDN